MLNLKELVGNINNKMSSVIKREVIKIIIATILLKTPQSNNSWINLWNNYKQEDMVDLYFEDLKNNKVILYKIVEAVKDKQKVIKKLSEIGIGLFEDKEIKIIEMKKTPNNILEMRDYLEERI